MHAVKYTIQTTVPSKIILIYTHLHNLPFTFKVLSATCWLTFVIQFSEHGNHFAEQSKLACSVYRKYFFVRHLNNNIVSSFLQMLDIRLDDWPVSDGIFDVVCRCVDEHVILVPSSTLHTDVLVDRTQILQLTVTDGDSCNTHIAESNQRHRQHTQSVFKAFDQSWSKRSPSRPASRAINRSPLVKSTHLKLCSRCNLNRNA